MGYSIQFVTFDLFPSARRTIEHEGLCIRIPRFLEIYFVSSSASSKTVHLVQWSFFQRNHPSNPPFPSRAFFKLSSASASIHFASISTFTPRCVFLAQGCYLSFCPRIQRLRGRASKMPPFQAVSPFPRENLKNGSAYRETFRLPSNMFSYKGYVLRDSQ